MPHDGELYNFVRPLPLRVAWSRVLENWYPLDTNSRILNSVYILKEEQAGVIEFRPETHQAWVDQDLDIRNEIYHIRDRSPYWLAYQWEVNWGNTEYVKRVQAYYGGLDIVYVNVVEAEHSLPTHFMFVCLKEVVLARRFSFEHELRGDGLAIKEFW
jgi:hypothetical protein